MATTRIMKLRVGKGKKIAQSMKSSYAYGKLSAEVVYLQNRRLNRMFTAFIRNVAHIIFLERILAMQSGTKFSVLSLGVLLASRGIFLSVKAFVTASCPTLA